MGEAVYVLKFQGINTFTRQPADLYINGHGGITSRLAMALRYETAEHARLWRERMGRNHARVVKVGRAERDEARQQRDRAVAALRKLEAWVIDYKTTRGDGPWAPDLAEAQALLRELDGAERVEAKAETKAPAVDAATQAGDTGEAQDEGRR